MNSYQALPEGYKEILSIDLQKDKKTMIFINGVAVGVALIMAVLAHFFVPITTLFDMSQGFAVYFVRLFVLMIGSVLYIILHELVHGITMKLCGTKKVKYGFNGIYAFAASDDYYDKKSYLMIAMAPVVFFGIFLAVLNCIVPTHWFWVVYLIQISNVSGAMGDFYVTARFRKLPNDILVKDYGVGMTVYSAK